MASMTQKRQAELLEQIEKRRMVLENSILSVVKGFTPAAFIWGPPGLGKSHLLAQILNGNCGRAWRHHTAHSTPKALFLSLHAEPDAIHLYEDCEAMLKTDLSASILRAACGAPDDKERWITYETANEKLLVKFQGAIIVASNQNLSKLNGPLQGVASRFRPIKWDMSQEERIATILAIADRPHVKCDVPLTAKECKKVASKLIDMVANSSSPTELDLRLFTEHALPAYAQSRLDESVNWEDMLNAKLCGSAATVADTQAERTKKLETLALKINQEGGTTEEKIARWYKQTELGQAIYYRHLKNAKQKDKLAST